jgi:hypothetical protein
MNSKVIIVGDPTTGAIINVSQNNPEYGHIKVKQIRSIIDDNGFLKRQSLSALIQGTVELLQEMGAYENQALDGKIIIKESLIPFNKKNPERDLKVAGKTGIVCSFEGQPIYRKTVYNTSGNAADITVQHDNVEELREAYHAHQASGVTSVKTEDFTI